MDANLINKVPSSIVLALRISLQYNSNTLPNEKWVLQFQSAVYFHIVSNQV